MRSSLEKELRKEYKELKKSIDFFSEQFDTMAERCGKIEKENSALKKENAALSNECKELKQKLAVLEDRVTNQEQYSRNKNIEIKGVPVADDEDLSAILKKLGDVVNEPISSADVDVCHRVPRKDKGCPNIVVQFHSRAKREAVIDKAKKNRISTIDLGYTSGDSSSPSDGSPVFINEHLCPAMKVLLGQVVERKKEKEWKYAWTKGGKIFARKTDTSNVLRISCVKDIDKMK